MRWLGVHQAFDGETLLTLLHTALGTIEQLEGITLTLTLTLALTLTLTRTLTLRSHLTRTRQRRLCESGTFQCV